MVQCSDSESFGLSVVESLATGVPVDRHPHLSVERD